METETLFTASKWDILRALSSEKLSPLELAKKTSTSVANISQSLRLLELGGLVRSERLSNRDKGQPRVVYSLAGNNAYLISAASNFVQKDFYKLTELNKITLKTWFYKKPEHRYYIEKAIWQIEEQLQEIKAIAVNKKSYENIELLIIGDKELKISDTTIKKPGSASWKVKFKTKADASGTNLEDYFVLYDPNNVLSLGLGEDERKKSQGGENE